MFTLHIHSKLREKFREALSTQTCSKHKELTPGRKKIRSRHVKALKDQLIFYGSDPFSEGKPKSVSTGVEMQPAIVLDMIEAKERGSEQFSKFVKERLIAGTKGFFEPMSRNKYVVELKRKGKPRNQWTC